ncbi:hypothetical protein [Roseibium litorale]|uniref:Uncharacterized protein n=1 Tax=Roseibium litorale TaxID=2803841 RepID=A0ABR9CJA1_9HYPH|nr:hypothetical protein [Roseibium litorale]MBD8890914.1 hypothetical protein [Roseibium litorale]
MNEAKSILQSRTIWGAVIAALAIVAGWFGYDVSAVSQAGLVDDLIAASDKIVALVGLAVVIYGRLSATKKLR